MNRLLVSVILMTSNESMKRLSFLIFLLSVGLSAFAQDSTIQYQSPRIILKLAPLALLLDPDATVQGGLEIRAGHRNSVQAEVGFGHKGLSITSDDKKKFADWSIWRVRSEWRHYTNRYRTNKRKNIHIRSDSPLGNYWAIEGFAKQINGTKTLVLYDPDPNYPTNQQEISRSVWGSHIKWGRQIAIPGSSLNSLSHVLLDFYAGVGFRYGITENNPTTGNYCGCGFVQNRFQPGHSIQPSITAGVKIGVGL